MFQIAAIGVAGAVMAVLFRAQKPEYGVCICLALGVALFFYILGYLKTIFQELQNLFGGLEGSGVYLTTLLKMVGIVYLAEFSAGICKDAGYQSIAGQIEIAAKLLLLTLSLPVLTTLLQTVREFLT